MFNLEGYGNYRPNTEQPPYVIESENVLYDELLSPTKIIKLKIKGGGRCVVKKSLMKAKLLTPMAHTFAIREQIIHEYLSLERHPNILNMHSYSTSADSYDMYLEYADRGEYLSS